MKIIAAPLQGYTEAPWRRFHAEVYGSGVDTYCAPFVRLEHGEIRPRDLRDTLATPDTIAQIICRDADEFRGLASALMSGGIKRIDLNLGCPFPPQVKHGRGAGLASSPERLREVLEVMNEFPSVEFSAKMRLDNWEKVLNLISISPIKSLTVHARYASQQYNGAPDIDEFAKVARATVLPLNYNGNINSRKDFDEISDRFPQITGVMIGRGLQARPSLASEIIAGKDMLPEERIEAILDLHRKIFEHYSATLCGPTQILSKIKPFWDFMELEIGHKAAKQIRKAGSLKNYLDAVNMI